jgi:DNA repair photolyase
VKANADEVLAKQLVKSPKGLVSLSTVTDPYQGPERKYKLTRAILSRLADAGFPVSILTKSDLVLRDADVLRRFSADSCEVGFSMISPDDAVCAAFEPGAPPVSSRLEALRGLHRAGVRTWVFLAPVLPVITEKGLPDLAESISGYADRVLVDSLNIKCGNWQGISRILSMRYPSLLSEWRAVLFSEREKESYYASLADRIQAVFARKGIPVEFC